MKVALAVLLAFVLIPTLAVASQDASGVIGTPAGRGTFPILAEIDLSFDDYCVGVGFDGTNFWVSAGDQLTGSCTFYIIDEYGTLVDQMPQAGGATSWGNRDLEWTGQYMFGSYSNRINGYDGAVNYMGYFTGPINPCRALTYDGSDFYTSGFGEMLYRVTWDGNWGSMGSSVPLSGPWDGAYGLAYDAVEDCLYMSTADYTGDIWKLDTAGNVLDAFTTLPEYDLHGGCAMAETRFGYVLAVLVQSAPDKVILYDLGHGPTATEETTWGAVKGLFR